MIKCVCKPVDEGKQKKMNNKHDSENSVDLEDPKNYEIRLAELPDQGPDGILLSFDWLDDEEIKGCHGLILFWSFNGKVSELKEQLKGKEVFIDLRNEEQLVAILGFILARSVAKFARKVYLRGEMASTADVCCFPPSEVGHLVLAPYGFDDDGV